MCPTSPGLIWFDRVARGAGCLTALCLVGGIAQEEQKLVPAAATWTVKADCAKNAEARTNLSGAACAPTRPPFIWCLVVNDEKQYAQFFALEGNTVVPGQVIRLVDKDADGNPDAEGATFADG